DLALMGSLVHRPGHGDLQAGAGLRGGISRLGRSAPMSALPEDGRPGSSAEAVLSGVVPGGDNRRDHRRDHRERSPDSPRDGVSGLFSPFRIVGNRQLGTELRNYPASFVAE